MTTQSRVDWQHVADRLAVALNAVLDCAGQGCGCSLCDKGERHIREALERMYFPAQATQEDIDDLSADPESDD